MVTLRTLIKLIPLSSLGNTFQIRYNELNCFGGHPGTGKEARARDYLPASSAAAMLPNSTSFLGPYPEGQSELDLKSRLLWLSTISQFYSGFHLYPI